MIKVEDTGAGDYVRADPPAFHSLNRGKRAVSIDLKNPQGRDAFLRLSARADVVLESFRPGVMDRLGVGYERLREENPRLVYCAITGYGQDGPFAARAGHDTNYLARIGLLGLTGDPDGPPVQAAGQIADLGGGALMAAFGILAALRERDRLRHGPARRRLDDRRRAVVAGDGRRAAAGRRRGAGARPHAARGRAHLLPPVPLRRRLGGVRGAGAEVLARLVRGRRPARPRRAPVRRRRLRHPRRGRGRVRGAQPRRVGGLQRRARLLPGAGPRPRRGARFRPRPRARDGRWTGKLLGTPVKLSRTPAEPAATGPERGADTDAVLAEAGYGAEEIAALRESGAVA